MDTEVDTEQVAARRPAWPRRAQLAFRHWRRSRPFWSGLLTMVAAVPLIYLPLAPVRVFFRLGLGAIAGATIAILLVIMGVSMWLTPHLKNVLGLMTVVLGLAAFPLTNLGGFFIGSLFAVLGGSSAVSWGQSRRQRRLLQQ